uniref:Apoptotic peptidase activating factor 1 n=1 Tax=Nothobranchius furzeri TaxID=105023 RepID=A0A8C6LU80_NOTFU
PTKPRLASDLEGSDWIGKGQCVILHTKVVRQYQQHYRDIPPTSGDEECLYWIRFLTYHMAKANLSQELYSLMFSLDWVSIKARIMGPAPLINDYVEHGSILDKENSDVRCQFQEFLSQSAHHLEQRPFPDVVQLALSQPHTSEVYRQARQQALNRAKGGKLYFDLINKRSVESLSYLVIHPHQGFIYSACFSHDGTKVASCGASKTLKVFKSTSGEKLAEIQAHEEEVLCCAFTYDDRLIATCSSDRKVKVWNAEQGKLLRAFAEEHEEQVNHCEFTNTDFLKLLLFLLFLALIHVSHISLPFNTMFGHFEPVNHCCFSPDDSYLSTSCNDGTVKLFQVSSANEWKTIDVRSMFADGEEVIVKCSTWSPDSKRVICAARNAVLVFDVESSDMLLEIRTNRLSMVQYCHACPTSNLLAIAFSNYALELWDLENSKKKADCSGHLSWVQRVQFSNDGSKLLSCSDDQTVRLWETQKVHTSSAIGLKRDSDVLFNNEEIIVSAADNCNRLQVSSREGSLIRCTCLSRHPSAVALGQESGSVQHLATLQGHTKTVLHCRFSLNGQTLITSSEDTTIRVWKWQSGECTVLQGHKEQVRCFSLLSDSMNDSSLLSWSFDGTVKVRSAHTRHIKQHPKTILSCHVSPDRCLFATTSADKTAKLWSIPSWQCTHTLRGHQECVRSCRFSWDSRRLATGDDNGEIRLWSVEDGSLLKICSRDGKGGMDSLHGGWVSDLHFSPDDSLLVSAGGYIKWWSVVTGEALQTFYPTGSALKKIHVSPDFSTFVTIDNIGILYILQRVV